MDDLEAGAQCLCPLLPPTGLARSSSRSRPAQPAAVSTPGCDTDLASSDTTPSSLSSTPTLTTVLLQRLEILSTAALALLFVLAFLACATAVIGPRFGLRSCPWEWPLRHHVPASAASADALPIAAAAAGCAPLTSLPPECDGHDYHISGDTLSLRNGLAGRNAWGNDLSPYWQARGIAHLAGLAYQSAPALFGPYLEMHHWWYTPDAWLGYLPAHVPRHSCPDLARLKQACRDCSDWQYPHMCAGGWSAIVPAIQRDTHAAFERWAADHGKVLPTYHPNDVVVQFRCERSTVLQNKHYGPIAYSFYSAIPPDVGTLTLLRDPRSGDALCADLLLGLQTHLASRHPGVPLAVVSGGELWEDWARMLYAPTLFKASSSLGLWAGVANTGTTHSAPLKMSAPHIATAQPLGGKWAWSEAETLYPSVADAAGLTRDDMEGIHRWLESH